LVGGYWAWAARVAWQRHRAERRARRRAGQAEAAAREAALEDGAFDPQQIRECVIDALAYLEATLRADQAARTRRGSDASILADSARSIRRLLPRPSACLLGRPAIDFLRVVNRQGQAEDRVVIRVRVGVEERLAHALRLPVLRPS